MLLRWVGIMLLAAVAAGVGWLRRVLRDQHGHAVRHD
jgi:lipopolysaccharide export system protein LptC